MKWPWVGLSVILVGSLLNISIAFASSGAAINAGVCALPPDMTSYLRELRLAVAEVDAKAARVPHFEVGERYELKLSDGTPVTAEILESADGNLSFYYFDPRGEGKFVKLEASAERLAKENPIKLEGKSLPVVKQDSQNVSALASSSEGMVAQTPTSVRISNNSHGKVSGKFGGTKSYAAQTDAGDFYKPVNEDAVFIGATKQDSHVFLSVDGVGGAGSGEVASDLFVKTVEKELAQGKTMAEALDRIEPSMWNSVVEGRGHSQMGATMVSAEVKDRNIIFRHAGDSRGYVIRGDKIDFQTVDHSAVEEQGKAVEKFLKRDFSKSSDEIREEVGRVKDANRSQDVMKAYGPGRHDGFETNYYRGVKGDRIVLCSDGCVDNLDPRDIERIVSSAKTPEAAANQLRLKAGDQMKIYGTAKKKGQDLKGLRGKPDNINIVVVFLD